MCALSDGRRRKVPLERSFSFSGMKKKDRCCAENPRSPSLPPTRALSPPLQAISLSLTRSLNVFPPLSMAAAAAHHSGRRRRRLRSRSDKGSTYLGKHRQWGRREGGRFLPASSSSSSTWRARLVTWVCLGRSVPSMIFVLPTHFGWHAPILVTGSGLWLRHATDRDRVLLELCGPFL